MPNFRRSIDPPRTVVCNSSARDRPLTRTGIVGAGETDPPRTVVCNSSARDRPLTHTGIVGAGETDSPRTGIVGAGETMRRKFFGNLKRRAARGSFAAGGVESFLRNPFFI